MSNSEVFDTLYQEEIYKVSSPLLIVLGKPWKDLTTDEHTTLSKIMHALNLTMAAVRVIERASFSISELAAFSPTRIVAFGANLHSPVNLFETSQIEGVSVIISEPLDQLDDAKKKSLWTALKAMFSL